MPDTVSDVVENFQKRLSELKEYADAQKEALSSATPPTWYRPESDSASGAFIGSPDFATELFSREELEEQMTQAMSSGGTTGDLLLIQKQGGLLQSMERAFRSRHQTFVRASMHAAARFIGHSNPLGAIEGGLMQEVVNLDKRNKAEAGTV